MAADIRQWFGIEAELIPSGGGVFEVLARDKIVFSKKAMGRFPEEEEIYTAMKAILGGA